MYLACVLCTHMTPCNVSHIACTCVQSSAHSAVSVGTTTCVPASRQSHGAAGRREPLWRRTGLAATGGAISHASCRDALRMPSSESCMHAACYRLGLHGAVAWCSGQDVQVAACNACMLTSMRTWPWHTCIHPSISWLWVSPIHVSALGCLSLIDHPTCCLLGPPGTIGMHVFAGRTLTHTCMRRHWLTAAAAAAHAAAVYCVTTWCQSGSCQLHLRGRMHAASVVQAKGRAGANQQLNPRENIAETPHSLPHHLQQTMQQGMQPLLLLLLLLWEPPFFLACLSPHL